MLVLTRKPGEGLIIGDNIKITVVTASDNSVKIGIEAPADVKILREELLQQISEQNTQALSWDLSDLAALNQPLKKK